MAFDLSKLNPDLVKVLMEKGEIPQYGFTQFPAQQVEDRSPAEQPQGGPSEYTPTEAGAVPVSSGPTPSPAPQPQQNPMDMEMRGLIAQLQAREDANAKAKEAAYNYAKGGVEDAEMAVKMAPDRTADLSPLLALSDAWFGGNLAKGYNAPLSAQQVNELQNKNLLALAGKKAELAGLAGVKGTDSILSKIALAQMRGRETQGRYDDKKATVTDQQAETINKFDTLLSETDNLKTTLKDDYVGPGNQLKGTFIGKQFPENFDAAEFQSQLGRLVDKYRSMVTGSAAADAELKRIESRMPQKSDPPALFRQKALNVLETTERARNIYLDTLKKKGKDVSGYVEPTRFQGAKKGSGLTDAEKEELKQLEKEFGNGG